MARYAIVIGIGAYKVPAWELPAAVPDALRFKDWVVAHGGVEPANVRLLLSPWPEGLDGYPQTGADRRSIVTAIQAFQTGAGQGADRLYLYYAGHGVSAPGVTAGGIQEPVIIPADVESLRVDAALLVGFSEIMPALLACEPREQFFFIDACRDFALEEEFQPGVGRSGIRWMPPTPGAGPRSAQYVLYSTSPGLKAYEREATGRGVFADVLLEALGGIPRATQWSSAERKYVVRWSTLVDYARETVAKRLPGGPGRGAELQLPEATTQGGAGDPDLFAIDEDKMARLDLRVRVGPSAARSQAKVQVLIYGPGNRELSIESIGPPVQASSAFSLSPGDYAVEATADLYSSTRKICRLWAASVEELELAPAEPAPPEARPRGGNESAMEGLPAEADSTRSFRGPPADHPVETTGRLHVLCGDPGALLAVWDNERRTVATGSGAISVPLPPGIYRVRMMLAEGDVEERTAEVRAGDTVKVGFGGGLPEMGAAQMAMLDRLDIRPGSDGTLHPSEQLGGFGRARLASLLGMAAFSATGPFRTRFRRLRRFGIDPADDAPSGSAPVLVLLGASGDEPLPDIDVAQFLAKAEVVARAADGSPVDNGSFRELAGFPAAAQRTFAAPTGSLVAELRLAGFGVVRFALACFRDRRTVLVVVAEGAGVLDVQQYAIPLSDEAPGANGLLDDSQNIRRLEIAQRYYAGPAEPRPRHELEELLDGKWLDPLLGALAGYSLVAQGDPAAFEVAVQNMLTHFPLLPDSHVLAGLCQPERRAEHYRRAVEAGLPVFSEGLRVLHQWFRESGDVPATLSEPSRRLVPGSPWTAWVATRPVLSVRDGGFGSVPLGWQVLEEHRAEIERTCAAVGRIGWAPGSDDFVATGFSVAPNIVLTASFVVDGLYDGTDGDWRPKEGRVPLIDFAEEPSGSDPQEFPITGVVGIDRDRQLALLAIASPSPPGKPAPTPLRVAATSPADLAGRAVYVVGYPMFDPRVEAGVVGAAIGGRWGIKRLQPGNIVGPAADDAITHDCFTLGGNSGSPLVDLTTGLVIGVHLSGRWHEYKTGEARPLWERSDDALFRDIEVEWVQPTA